MNSTLKNRLCYSKIKLSHFLLVTNMRRGVLKALNSKEAKSVTTFSFNYILTLSNKKSKKAIFGF